MTGGMITHLLDSCAQNGQMDIVSLHHEQAAAFAAEADSWITGIPGVAMATSGPGATNLITGIGSCYFDSVPAVFITGQVNTNEQRGTGGVRQSGFQETDIVEIAAPITKAAWRVNQAAALPSYLQAAFETALSGRKGPVLLDIAMDVQRDELTADVPVKVTALPNSPVETEVVDRTVEAIASAQRPLILAGGGVRASGARDALVQLATRLGVPVVTSLMGLDLLPDDNPLRAGLIGTYGNRWANEALGKADLLLVLGSRLDVRQTGARVDRFIEGKTIIRVDIDPAELDWRVPSEIRVESDLGGFMSQLLSRPDLPTCDRSWPAEILAMRDSMPDQLEITDVPGVNPAILMHELSRCASELTVFVSDVGQNQMWAAQSLRLSEGQRFLTSGGMGAMGFALPAAIGAAKAALDRPVIVVAGDGGAQVNIQELETISRLGLPVKIVILDNGCLGMVRQFQDEHLDRRRQSTVTGYGAPDFAAVAAAYGIPARAVSSQGEVCGGIAWLMERPLAPAVLHVQLDRESMVRPKVLFGDPVFVMEPPPTEAGA